MNQNQIDKLIMEFIGNTISDKDFLWLEDWLKEEDNRAYFNGFLKINYLLNISTPFNGESSLEEIKSKIKYRYNNQKLPPYLKYVAIAASIAVLITTGFWFTNIFRSDSQFVEPIIVNNNIKTGTDKATLTLISGEEVTLVKGTTFQTQSAISNGEEIIYSKNTSKEIAYNTLTIPRGGQFQLTLADGTQVWLNSESQLKYPVAFTVGQTRRVELVYGEAYFDVSPSTEHKGSKFKVFNNSQEVEVLGTKFNIKAYKDETNIYTTLVEGKVVINVASQNQILEPSEQSTLDILTNRLLVATVNVRTEISWKEGVFRFREMPLKDIMKVLSRWYDFDVIFENKTLESDDITFKGVIGRNQNIQSILSAIKSSKTISNYEINNKTIILK